MTTEKPTSTPSDTHLLETKMSLKCLVDLRSFEPIHGMSRIVRLKPENLSTEMVINRDNLSNPDEDDGFLVDLVQDLVKFYLDRKFKIEERNFQKWSDELTSVKHKLRRRKMQKLNEKARILSHLIDTQVRDLSRLNSKY